MTMKDNTIQALESENNFFVHLNRLLIVSILAYTLLLDDYQTSDKYFGLLTVIWLWESELRTIEIRIAGRHPIKQFFVAFITASVIVSIYIVFVKISPWLFSYEVWFLLAFVLAVVVPIFFKTIHWLVINSPVYNIGKECRNEGALK